MQKRNEYIGFYGVFFLVIISCLLPGQAAQPTLATDPNSVSTFIAGTSQALAAQTQQAAALITPSITPTVIPTETLIPTPQISLEKTSLVVQNDQSTVFTDYKAGIEITFPAIWMPFRVGEKEYYKAWEAEFVKNNQMLLDQLNSLQTANLANIRVHAFDTRPEYIFNEMQSEIGVTYEENGFRTLEEWLEVEKHRPQYADHELISTTFRDTPNNIHIFMLEHRIGASEGQSLYYREIIFGVPGGTVFINCYSDFEFRDSMIADFDRVIDGIVLLKQ